jgi:putative transposase
MAELVCHRGPWKTIDDLEIAVTEYIDSFNHRRLRGEMAWFPQPGTRRATTVTTLP